MTERYVVFSHGKDSEPWGSKIAAMAEIAREEGFHVESVDYRGIARPALRQGHLPLPVPHRLRRRQQRQQQRRRRLRRRLSFLPHSPTAAQW